MKQYQHEVIHEYKPPQIKKIQEPTFGGLAFRPNVSRMANAGNDAVFEWCLCFLIDYRCYLSANALEKLAK